jgi:hypothetical protein
MHKREIAGHKPEVWSLSKRLGREVLSLIVGRHPVEAFGRTKFKVFWKGAGGARPSLAAYVHFR